MRYDPVLCLCMLLVVSRNKLDNFTKKKIINKRNKFNKSFKHDEDFMNCDRCKNNLYKFCFLLHSLNAIYIHMYVMISGQKKYKHKCRHWNQNWKREDLYIYMYDLKPKDGWWIFMLSFIKIEEKRFSWSGWVFVAKAYLFNYLLAFCYQNISQF